MGDQLSFFDNNRPRRPPGGRRSQRNDVRTGDAAETLVMLELLLLGYDAHRVHRDAAYDLAVPVYDAARGWRTVRVQVKGTTKPDASGKWNFRFTRGNWRSATGCYSYDDTDFDITACASLSLRRIQFFSGVHPSIRLNTADFLRPDGEAESWDQALQVVKRKLS